jgi:hypothetical protein
MQMQTHSSYNIYMRNGPFIPGNSRPENPVGRTSHDIAQHSTAQHSTTQHNTTFYIFFPSQTHTQGRVPCRLRLQSSAWIYPSELPWNGEFWRRGTRICPGGALRRQYPFLPGKKRVQVPSQGPGPGLT